MTALTDRERHMMRHALGLTNRKVGYRNKYIAGPSAAEVWRNLVARGLAHEQSRVDDSDELPMFSVRLAGVVAVLRDGERMDREEADYVMRLERFLSEPRAIEVAA